VVDDRSLAGRCAVITGGSRGLGRAIALALADAGVSRIGLVARVASELEAAASEVRDAGAEVVMLVSDLSDGEELSHLDQRSPCRRRRWRWLSGSTHSRPSCSVRGWPDR
jgi:short-subunit dehydrogenase